MSQKYITGRIAEAFFFETHFSTPTIFILPGALGRRILLVKAAAMPVISHC